MAVRSPSAYEKSVFINCPFDRDYQDLMLAIVFSVAAHRLLPRSARETEGDPEPRFSRILGAIAESKYSIHDLCLAARQRLRAALVTGVPVDHRQGQPAALPP